MSDRIHVTMALDLFVEDATAMRQAAFERLRSAWSSEEDFPYESEADVSLEEAVHSLLADALPAELPGCRRSQLEVEVESQSGGGSKADSRDDAEVEPTAGESSSEEESTNGESQDKDD